MHEILKHVRLEEFQYKAIISAFTHSFLHDDKLWVFGSRVDMHKSGGDIDLYIETMATTAEDALKFENKFVHTIWEKIGDQKIDVVLNMVAVPGNPLPIYDVAKNHGVRLL